jgi:YHS domain-containing protein
MKRIIFLLILILAGQVFAIEPINTFGPGGSFFSDPDRTGVAIKGYDTVAYFKEKKPVAGKDEFMTSWMGAKWKFANKENLDDFKASPEKYAPQYGGYCAYGIANGSAVKIEPEQWTIIDDKLYLNYDEGVSKKWKKDPAKYIKQANEKFSSILKK